jgi:hypothetical protein
MEIQMRAKEGYEGLAGDAGRSDSRGFEDVGGGREMEMERVCGVDGKEQFGLVSFGLALALALRSTALLAG